MEEELRHETKVPVVSARGMMGVEPEQAVNAEAYESLAVMCDATGESEFPRGSSAARCSAPRAASGAVVLILQAGDIFAGVVAPAEAERHAGGDGGIVAQRDFVFSHLRMRDGDSTLKVYSYVQQYCQQYGTPIASLVERVDKV